METLEHYSLISHTGLALYFLYFVRLQAWRDLSLILSLSEPKQAGLIKLFNQFYKREREKKQIKQPVTPLGHRSKFWQILSAIGCRVGHQRHPGKLHHRQISKLIQTRNLNSGRESKLSPERGGLICSEISYCCC